MIHHKLGQTNIEVSSLGFGCVQLTAHKTRKETRTILEHAFSLGITHFDVARLYGFGRAEGILADFIQDKRHLVTIATKFGFEFPSGLPSNPYFISLTKKILSPFPRLLRFAKYRGSSMIKKSSFTPHIATKSLETSLRELKTDYIDIFLLHEALFSDVTNEALIETLQQQVTKGTIRCFGIASDFSKLNDKITLIPSAHQILQFNDNIIDRNISKLSCYQNKSIITHSIFKPINILLKLVNEQIGLTKKFSSKIDLDLCDQNTMSTLLLHYAMQNNTRGIVLFSSMNPDHIQKNVEESNNHIFYEKRLIDFIEFVNEILELNNLIAKNKIS